MPTAPSNRLIDALPRAARRAFIALLEPVALPVGTVLFETGVKPRHVHFMTSGLTSLMIRLADGSAVEVGLSGREGFPESTHLLGPQTGNRPGVVQIAGSALRMDFSYFDAEFNGNPALRHLVLRLIQYEALVLGQVAACNCRHKIEKRLARWLLMVSERTGDTTVVLTHEILSQMLGTTRSSVTVAARALQWAGLIEYRRADIHILDVVRLQAASCECAGSISTLLINLYR